MRGSGLTTEDVLYGELMQRSEVVSAPEGADGRRSGYQLVQDLFTRLDGKTYTGDAAFIDAVCDSFNQDLHEYPVGYNYKDAISWGQKQGWIYVAGSEISVQVIPG